MHELTVEEIAALACWSARTAKRRVKEFHLEGWPRTRRAKAAGESRWRYLVDAAEFRAWANNEPRPAAPQSADAA